MSFPPHCFVTSNDAFFLQTVPVYRWNNFHPVSYQNWRTLRGIQSERVYKFNRIAFSFHILSISNKTLFPSYQYGSHCTLMMLQNLAMPEWIPIDCSENHLKNLVCTRDRVRSNRSHQVSSEGKRTCERPNIKKNSSCFVFTWHQHAKMMKSAVLKPDMITMFEFVFDAIDSTFPPLLVPMKNNYFAKVSFRKALHLYTYSSQLLPKEEAEGFLISRKSQKNSFSHILGNLVLCKDNSLVSLVGVKDHGHVCHFSVAIFKCSPLNTDQDRNKSCTYLYKKVKGKWVMYHSSTTDWMLNKPQLDNTDEDNLWWSTHPSKFNTVCKHGDLPCSPGHKLCYSLVHICKYKLNKNNHLVPCLFGGNIQTCRDFECIMMFKCKDHYCVPWQYVCDEKWDCPGGFDEKQHHRCEPRRSCSHLFKCRNSSMCIPFADVCNRRTDCCSGDDEYLCELHSIQCPAFCECLALAIECRRVTVFQSNHIVSFPYISVVILNCQIPNFAILLVNIQNVENLHLSSCGLTQICSGPTYNHLQNVVIIDNSFNNLTSLHTNCFHDLPKLSILFLGNNKIDTIQTDTFNNVTSMKLINLTHNFLSHIPERIIFGLVTLKMLSISKNNFTNFHKEAFIGIDIVFLETDDDRTCCLVADVPTNCSAPQLWHRPCSNLLNNSMFKTVCLVFVILIAGTNGLSIVLHAIYLGRKNNFGKILFVSQLSNVLLSITHAVILVADSFFGKSFGFNRDTWTSSFFCSFIFFLGSFIHLNLPHMGFLISFSRLMVVWFPMESRFKRQIFVSLCVGCCVAVEFVSALCLTFFVKLETHNIPTFLCFPFVDPANDFIGVKIISLITGSNSWIFLAAIILVNIELGHKRKKQSEESISPSSNRKIKATLWQITGFCASYIICWIPFNIINLFVQFSTDFTLNILFWNVLVIYSLSPILHPVIHMIVLYRKEKKSHPMKNC